MSHVLRCRPINNCLACGLCAYFFWWSFVHVYIEINLLYNILNFFVIFNVHVILSIDHFEHIVKLIIQIGEYLYLDLITYKLGIWVAGSWKFLDSTNGSSRFPDLRKSTGNSMIELVSTPTKITGVHYVQVSRWNCR